MRIRRFTISAAVCIVMFTTSATAATTLVANLEGPHVVPPVATGATGTATLVLNDTGDSLTYIITLNGLDLDGLQTPDPNDDVVALHIHFGPVGVNGPVVFGMISPGQDPDDIIVNPAAGTISGTWETTDASTSPLVAETGNLVAGTLYISVHTAAFPAGEIRGQIQVGLPTVTDTALSAILEGPQEVPPVATAAIGTATLVLNDTGDSLTYIITLNGLDLDGLQTPDPNDDVVAMHIHFGSVGVNGPVVFGMISPGEDPDDLVINPAAGTISGAWEVTDPSTSPLVIERAELLAGNLYINVHTPEFPAGEIRGQIQVATVTGREPVAAPALSPAGLGLLAFLFGGLGAFGLRRRVI